MAKEDVKPTDTDVKKNPVNLSDGEPISSKPGTVFVAHEKKDGSKIVLEVITN